ncbi:SAM-dependent methyltransferase [Streptomyces sp. NPDC051172]|uniref:SAM-dependent methyltransferase n=1 Tax=Streptomyces sp. NPDC051172 TaxID=3155796 RepID=UPI00344651E5
MNARPVALLLIALLHFVPDEDGAHELVRRLLPELPSGSCLVAGCATADSNPRGAEGRDRAAQGRGRHPGTALPRGVHAVLRRPAPRSTRPRRTAAGRPAPCAASAAPSRRP